MVVTANIPLTEEQIRYILQLIQEKHGFGWVNHPVVSPIQASCSVGLAVISKLEHPKP